MTIDTTYPLFEGGQTLTATDLNLLRSFLHERDRFVGRMVGFGINAGLAGTVTGNTLTIAPGLAIDQAGEPLVLSTTQTIALPPTPVTPSFPFIATGSFGGFSVVLEAAEAVDPAPACGELDCAGHAEHHTSNVALRVVSGRLTGTRFDFSSEVLLAQEPIRLGLDSAPITSFETLRNAIADRLTNGSAPLIAPGLITELRSRSIGATNTPAVRGYKAGWLNMVLFATLDLLRIEALLSISANRSTTRPGVVLGWVHQVSSGSWVFECGYRHQWEPPRGFTEALLGGNCGDPAGHYRDLVESLISGYAPPDPPPAGGGPVDPPVHCPPGTIRIGNQCRHIYFPPPDIPDLWYEEWLFPIDPLGPIWDPPFEDPGWLVNPWDIYGDDPIDFFGDGQIGGLQYVGQPGGDVQAVLEDFIDVGGGVADVRVVSHTEAQGLDGYHPASSFSPSDTIVLSVNQAGNVVATGRVAAVRNTRRVASALPAAESAVAEAQQVATELTTLATGLQNEFSELQTGVGELGQNFLALQGEFADYQGGQFDTSGYGVRIGNLEQDLLDLGGIGQRIATLEGQLSQLEDIGQQVIDVQDLGQRIATVEGQLSQLEDIGKQVIDIRDFGQRVANVEGQLSQFANLGDQVAEVGKFKDRIATIEGQVSNEMFGERIATLEGQVGFFGKEMVTRGQVKGMSPMVGRGFAEFAETTVAAVRAMEKSGTLTQRYAKDVERAHAQFEVEVATGDPEIIGTAALGLMKSMRTMVKAATKDTPEGATLGSQLDAQIRNIEQHFG